MKSFNSVLGIERYGVTYYYCPKNCGRKYKYKTGIRTHLKYECGVPKSFVCTFCGKAFARKDHHKTHVGVVHKVIL